jgi:prepilin-type N-terminal cleavage/methylation domain-containing protein
MSRSIQSPHGPRSFTDVRRGHRRAGFTLIEVLAAMSILTIAAGAIVSTLITSGRVNREGSEVALAREALESVIERVKSTPFRDVFATFNADPADDPGGAGTAPGASFAAQSLRPVPGDPDGLVGEVIFPTVGAALREDVDDPRMSMPRDLDFDGAIDADDHAADYMVLPLVVRVAWRGPMGDRFCEQSFNLGDLR